MKKSLLAIGILIAGSQVSAELTDLHFYALSDQFNKDVIIEELADDETQLLELDDTKKNVAYQAPLHIAVLQDNFGAVELFSEFADYIDVKNSYGQTALMLALKASNFKIVEVLVKAGASLETLDINGNKVSAYAKVGDISYDSLVKIQKGESIDVGREASGVISQEDQDQIDEETDFYTVRVAKLEDNMNDLISLIEQNSVALDNVKVDPELYKKVNDTVQKLESVNSLVTKQAQILIPLVKTNMNSLKTLNAQIMEIDLKTKELTEKIALIDELTKKVEDGISNMPEVPTDINDGISEKTKEEMQKLAEELKKQAEQDANPIPNVNVTGEIDEPISSNNIMDVILENLTNIILGLVALIAVGAVLFRSKIAKKKETNEKLANIETLEVEDEDDNDNEETASEVDHVLNHIEIETSDDEDGDDEIVSEEDLFEESEDENVDDLFDDEDEDLSSLTKK